MLKKIFCFFLFLLSAFYAAYAAEERTMFKNDSKTAVMPIWISDGKEYVQASKAAKALSGKIDVLSASGKVVFKSRKLQVVFKETSDSVYTNGSAAEFSQPMLVRAGIPYLSIEYLSSDIFAKAYGKKISFKNEKQPAVNEKASSTAVAKDELASGQHAIEVKSLRCGSHEDRTRIVLNLSEPGSWEEEHTADSFILRISGAVSRISAPDGKTGPEVKDVSVVKTESGAELRVSLSSEAGEIKVFRLSSPDRLVSDIYRAKPGSVRSEESDDGSDYNEIESLAAMQSAQENASDNNEENIDIYPELKPLDDSGISAGSASVYESASEPAPETVVVTEEQRRGKKVIVIDAGHGGHDSGTHFDITKVTYSYKKNKKGKKVKVKNTKVIRTIKEKDLNLLQAKELIKLFEKDSRFKAVLTRDKDYFVTLPGRSTMAKNLKADAFISLHINSAGKNPNNACKPHGFEIFSMTEDKMDSEALAVAARENTVFSDEEREALLAIEQTQDTFLQMNARNSGYLLAEAIAEQFKAKTSIPPNGATGVKKANFAVLRRARFPSVLVESGFLCNASDRPKLEDPKVRKKIAEAIYHGLVNYGKNAGWFD